MVWQRRRQHAIAQIRIELRKLRNRHNRAAGRVEHHSVSMVWLELFEHRQHLLFNYLLQGLHNGQIDIGSVAGRSNDPQSVAHRLAFTVQQSFDLAAFRLHNIIKQSFYAADTHTVAVQVAQHIGQLPVMRVAAAAGLQCAHAHNAQRPYRIHEFLRIIQSHIQFKRDFALLSQSQLYFGVKRIAALRGIKYQSLDDIVNALLIQSLRIKQHLICSGNCLGVSLYVYARHSFLEQWYGLFSA